MGKRGNAVALRLKISIRRDSKETDEQWRLTADPASTLGGLMNAIPSVSLTDAGLKSAIEGSGVVTRNEEMYSSPQSLLSRSSMSKARDVRYR